MKKNKTRMVAAIAAVMCAGVCLAGPRPGHGPGPGPGGRGPAPKVARPAPVVHHGGHVKGPHHHGWGRGGSGFVGGVVGGIVGGILYDAVTTPAVTYPSVVVQSPPVVVQSPVYATQDVWVPGCYVNQVLANGTVIRVWQPGHYEKRTVVVQ